MIPTMMKYMGEGEVKSAEEILKQLVAIFGGVRTDIGLTAIASMVTSIIRSSCQSNTAATTILSASFVELLSIMMTSEPEIAPAPAPKSGLN